MRSNFNQVSEFSDLFHLSANKLQQLDTVLKSILALPIAQDTYAQIIDGNPTWHSTPNHKARQQYEEFRKSFIAQTLKLNKRLTERYRHAPLDSREHSLRLLEIAAASVNTLAGTMYSFFHPDMDIMPRVPPDARGQYFSFLGTDRFYVDFHDSYMRFENYPLGLLDVVGYWAETKLFGGVLLFDRGRFGLQVKNAFVHPKGWTQAFQLSTQQIARFSSLAKSDDAAHLNEAGKLLPFTQEPDAHTEKTFVEDGGAPARIYKNSYDTPPPSFTRSAKGLRRCVVLMGGMAVEDQHSGLSNIPQLKIASSNHKESL